VSEEIARASLDARLLQRIAEVGFTASSRDLAGLAGIVARGDEVERTRALRAIRSVQGSVGARLGAALAGLDDEARVEVLDALRKGAVAAQPDAKLDAALIALLGDASTRVRRLAARWLGERGGDEARAGLRGALSAAARADDRRSLLRALAPLGALSEPEIVELHALGQERASLVARRATASPAQRVTPGDVPRSREPVTLVWRCRRGLEEIVASEIRARLGLGSLEPTLAGVVARGVSVDPREALTVRTASTVAFELGRAHDHEAIFSLLRGAEGVKLARWLGLEQPRFRVEWVDELGRPRRADARTAWAFAAAFPGDGSGFVNDPRRSDVTLRIEEHGARRVLVEPSESLELDGRFAYRRADVPAASFPPIAAALVRVTTPHPDDIVWDPFVGSGLELCERALFGPARGLHGTDVDPAAIAKARANLAQALSNGPPPTLVVGDFRRHVVENLSVVVTNPPMGRRVLEGRDLERLMVDLVETASRALVPGGRLVLLSPRPRASARVAEARGLEQAVETCVDLGGFDAWLQRFDRPVRSRSVRGT
jgi:23S rRNA G2445 N2-methylase RlmL